MIFDNTNSSNSETLTGGKKNPCNITFCETPLLDDRNRQMSLLLFHSMVPSSPWEESVFLDPEISTPRKLFSFALHMRMFLPIGGFCLLSACLHPVQLGKVLPEVLPAGMVERKRILESAKPSFRILGKLGYLSVPSRNRVSSVCLRGGSSRS